MRTLDIIIKREDFERAPRNVENLITSVLNKGQSYTSITASREVKERYGISIDWHIVGYVLDAKNTSGYLKSSGCNSDGMTIYYLP